MNNLKSAIGSIESQFGDGSIMTGGKRLNVRSLSTGCATIDKALGVGGLPCGRIIEIFGPESSGKTTWTLGCIAEAQKTGKVAFIDAEHALDPEWAENIGVNMDELLLNQPSSGEEALNIAHILTKTKELSMIVIDSVSALVPKAEIEGEIGDSNIGLQARMMSQALRKLAGEKSPTIIIFINQIRHKIGVMFGNPETTSGGMGLKFYASCRLDIRRIAKIDDNKKNVGARTRIKVIKNKVAPPFKEAEFNIFFGESPYGIPIYGIDKYDALFDVAIELDIVQRNGSNYSYGDTRLGNGKANAVKVLVDNDFHLFNKIAAEVHDKQSIKPAKDHFEKSDEEFAEELGE